MAEDNKIQGLAWFIAGLGVGALVGILYAPKSGRETREDLAQGAREGTEYLRNRTRQAVEDMGTLVDKGKEQMNEYVGRGREAVDRGRAQWEEFVERGKSLVSDHTSRVSAAVEAGRDAYVEKPIAHTMADARRILAAVKKSGKIVQVGTQRRSTPAYQKAAEYIKSGKFGDIVMVEMSWNVNQPGRWRRPDVVPLLKEADTDWKRYSLDRNMGPFNARKYLEFRLFWPFSSGIPDQWLVHQIDTVHWFTGLPHPRSCVANGGIYLWKDGRTNWDTMTAVFDYGPLDDLSKGFQVQYTSRFTNSAGGVKELYYSNGGMIDMNKQTVSPTGGLSARSASEMKMQPNLLPSFSLVEKTETVETGANTHGDPQTAANMRNWMECVRSRKTPNAPIEAGYSHSVALCMNVAAIQTGMKVTFDDKTQQVLAGGKVYA